MGFEPLPWCFGKISEVKNLPKCNYCHFRSSCRKESLCKIHPGAEVDKKVLRHEKYLVKGGVFQPKKK